MVSNSGVVRELMVARQDSAAAKVKYQQDMNVGATFRAQYPFMCMIPIATFRPSLCRLDLLSSANPSLSHQEAPGSDGYFWKVVRSLKYYNLSGICCFGEIYGASTHKTL